MVMRGLREKAACPRQSAIGVALALSALAAFAAPSDGRACGYHDDVTLARGLMNWIYPDALHVLGATSIAVSTQRLTAPDQEPEVSRLLGSSYRITVQALQRIAQAMNAISDQPSPFSLVLVEPMLWTQFQLGEGALQTRIHASGPGADDLVVVSSETVIRAIAGSRFAIGEAYGLGLIRLYGSAAQKAQFLATYGDVGHEQRRGPSGIGSDGSRPPAGAHE